MAFKLTTAETDFRKSDLSILAIVETALAMSLTLFVAVYFNSLFHIAVGALIAPFLLVRSPESVALGIELNTRLVNKLGRERDEHERKSLNHKGQSLLRRMGRQLTGRAPERDDVFLSTIRFRYFWNSVGIRISATLRFIFVGIRYIPRNWVKSLLRTDSHLPVTLVPGTGGVSTNLRRFGLDWRHNSRLDVVFSSIGSLGLLMYSFHLMSVEREEFFGLYMVGAAVCFLMSVQLTPRAWCFGTAFVYRFSIKGTALLWLPLILALNSARSSESTEARLDDILNSAVSRTGRVLAAVFAIAIFLKLFWLPSQIEWWNSLNGVEILDVYVGGKNIYTWHIATLANSVLIWSAYLFYFERTPSKMMHGLRDAQTVDSVMRVYGTLRIVLSSYTIFVGLLLTIEALPKFNLPTWVPGWLPKLPSLFSFAESPLIC